MNKFNKKGSVVIEDLYASELSYRSLFEASKDGILILDAETGKIVDVNPFLIDLLGYTKKEFIEKSIWEIGSFQDIYKNKEKFLELRHTETVRYDDLPLVTSAGHKVHVEFVSNVYLVNNSKVIQCNIRDITERKGKENSLKEKHRATSDSLNSLLDHMHTPMIIWDTSMIIRRFNRQFELLSGYDSSEVIDKKIDFLFPQETIASTLELLKNHLDDDHTVTEIAILTKDHKIKTVLWNSSHILDEEGEHIIATISQDITNRKLTEDALALMETRYRRLFESAKDGILILDAETGKIVDVNPFLIDLLGYTKQEFIEKFIWEIGALQDIYENKEKFLELQKEEYVRYDDLPLVTSTGRKIHVEFVSNVYLANNMKVIQCNIRDNTERTSIQNEIKFQADLINNVGQAVIATDLPGKVTYWNRAAEKIYGWSAAEAIGQHIIDLTPAQQSNDQATDIMKKLSAGKTWSGEFHVKRKDGSSFPAFVTDTPILDSNGNLAGIIGISSDITERKRTEMELISAKERAEESDRLKTAFLHNISHEIRTPLNAIVGFSGFLNDPDLIPEKRDDYTDIIIQSSDQLLAIIDDIIRIASIEAGQEKIQETEININSICKLIYEQFSPKANDKHVTLTMNTVLADDEAFIITDTTKLTQILTNLIGNALKFTRQGYVNFGYSVKKKQLEFYVEDSGIGIPLDMQEKIFNRFRQVETTYSRHYGGSGLGLSISKAYVEMLGGTMWLSSELGIGSMFNFTIPYKNTNPKKLIDTQSIKNKNFAFNSTKTLLIAEDTDTNYMLLEAMLSDSGIHIIRAVNGIEAVKLCKSNQAIDLVLMDIKMPEMDGYEATTLIKKSRPDLPIIAQTAYITEADKMKALSCGCSDFISKPIHKELLLSKINDQLHK